MATISCCQLFGSWGLFLMLILVGVLVFLPLLLQAEHKLFWAWLFVFPFAYYEPFRLGNIFYAGKWVAPFFVLIATPGACWAILSRYAHCSKLYRTLLPLWFLFIGFFVQCVLHGFKIRTNIVFRDLVTPLIAAYMAIILWEWLHRDHANGRKLLNGLLGLGIFNAVMLIGQYALKSGMVVAGDVLRPIGLFGFPYMSAYIALFSVILAMYAMLTETIPKNRQRYAAGISVLVLGCLASLTKTVISQLLVLLAIWFWVLPRRIKTRVCTGFLLLAILMAGLAVAGVEIPLLADLTSRFSRTETLDIRLSVWRVMLEHMDTSTVLIGHGWLSSSYLLGIYNYSYGLFPVDRSDPGWLTATHPHNAYIKYTYDLGLCGLFAILSYLAIMLISLYQALRTLHPDQRLASLAIASLCLIVLIVSTTGIPTGETYTLIYLTVVLTLMGYYAGWFSDSDILRWKETAGALRNEVLVVFRCLEDLFHETLRVLRYERQAFFQLCPIKPQ